MTLFRSIAVSSASVALFTAAMLSTGNSASYSAGSNAANSAIQSAIQSARDDAWRRARAQENRHLQMQQPARNSRYVKHYRSRDW